MMQLFCAFQDLTFQWQIPSAVPNLVEKLNKGLVVTIQEITPQPKLHVEMQEIQQATNENQILQLLMKQLMGG